MNNAALNDLATKLLALTSAIAAKPGLTFAQAWNDPSIAGARNDLVKLLTDTSEIDKLLAASAEAGKEHQLLVPRR